MENINFHVLVVATKADINYLDNTIQSIIANKKFFANITVFLPKEVNYNTPKANMTYQTYDDETLIFWHIHAWLLQNNTFDAYLFIKSGVIIPIGTDKRLNTFIQNIPDTQIFTVSPCADEFLLPSKEANTTFELASVLEIDALLYFFSKKNYLQLPFFYENCFCLNRNALPLFISSLLQLKPKNKANYYWQLSRLTAMQGCAHFFIDFLFIQNKAKINTPLIKHNSLKQYAIENSSLKNILKQAVNFNMLYKDYESISNTPVQLHIMHSWGGGLAHWVHTYCKHDKNKINLILVSSGSADIYGEVFELYLHSDSKIKLEKWQLSSAIGSTDINNLGYKTLLDEIIQNYKVDTILISSFIGHSLDILKTSLPTIIICHDYYPFCQAIHIYYNGLCQHCDQKKLINCYKYNSENFLFKNSPQEWMALRQTFIALLMELKPTFIYPTLSVKVNYEMLEPRLKKITSFIISHGINFETYQPKGNFYLFHKYLKPHTFKIIIIGRLTPAKGLNLIKEVHKYLEKDMCLFLIGCGDEAAHFFSWKRNTYILPSYINEELPYIVEKIDPHLGLLLSVVHETFSYTLSELFFLKIPVLATNSGSFKDRIQDEVNGFLCEPLAKAIVEKLTYLKNNSDKIKQVKLNLVKIKQKSVEEMISEYTEVLPINKKSNTLISIKNISSTLINEEAYKNFLDTIYQSTSWQITYPLRALKSILQKICRPLLSTKYRRKHLKKIYGLISWKTFYLFCIIENTTKTLKSKLLR